MPLPLQVKMLRVIQERSVPRLGGTRTLPIDARIIAATNRDIEALRQGGGLPRRPVLPAQRGPVEVPPLRERRRMCPSWPGTSWKGFAPDLANRPGTAAGCAGRARGLRFPGQHRELENILERAMITCEGRRSPPISLAVARVSSWERPSNPSCQARPCPPPRPRQLRQSVRPSRGRWTSGRGTGPGRRGAGHQPPDDPVQDQELRVVSDPVEYRAA